MHPVDRTIGEKLRHGWADLFRQVGLFALADLCYETVRGIAEGQQAIALVHGQQIVDLERSTGTFFESNLQAAILPHHWLIDLANQIYLNSQFAVTVIFLGFLYLFRNEAYYFVRNMFMVAMGLALIGYTFYPTAPPRLLAQHGFVDTITNFSKVNHDSGLVKLFVNPYAAVPSMHCAFALMIGATGVRVTRHALSKAFWVAWPLAVAFAVIVTANHYWVDVAAGAVVALLAALVSQRLLARARPDVWSFRRAPSEARA